MEDDVKCSTCREVIPMDDPEGTKMSAVKIEGVRYYLCWPCSAIYSVFQLALRNERANSETN